MKTDFTTAVIGLGLMGGSLAYALQGFKDGAVTGFDTDRDVMKAALDAGAIDIAAASAEEAAAMADLVIFCSGPDSILENMKRCLPLCKKGAVITDICGVKKEILDYAAAHLPGHVDYVGLHPMAGKEVGGFANADKNLFRGAGFILVLPESYHQASAELITALSLYVGAGRVVANRADEHDAIIAYTSDLMHISATALCIGYPPNMTMAHAAGAFRDCTRIASIDADLWTALLAKNAEHIVPHLETLIQNLNDVKAALADGDQASLHAFLQKACDNKKVMLSL